ncbi:DHH family phosphoesterase [Mesoterricola sediminis]|uniref:Phosphoesterase RecJ-like protein n=1 Tax=Mesoterricola sediminis TaxID=2927980 RepID=A0AA48GU44_9BACT|nr:bifunctional oligoribonuclease/PAP phosphatase NrnA [Mesoterricola sediminis]BDU77637.1 phosphoesterase RecJ-like protein [Mesoterricola sediminis]
MIKEVGNHPMLNRFAAYLEQPRRILLTTHENPDGDGAGAMVGLAHYLRAQGKEVRIVVAPHLPDFLRFLDPDGWVEALDLTGRHADLASWPDVWAVVDASEPHRLGPLLPAFQATRAARICLDHHLKEAPAGFDAEFTDPAASASAELVYELAALRMPLPLPSPMAQALYAGIVEDTGNFRFSNATPRVHRIAAQLIEQGVDPAATYRNLYHQGRLEKLRLTGRALERMTIQAEGRYARISLAQADLDACGADHDDMEGLVNRPLEVKGVEVACLLYALPDGRVKASLRSREAVNVNAICKRFGGGGHRLASGAKLDGPLARAEQDLDAAVLAEMAAGVSHV